MEGGEGRRFQRAQRIERQRRRRWGRTLGALLVAVTGLAVVGLAGWGSGGVALIESATAAEPASASEGAEATSSVPTTTAATTTTTRGPLGSGRSVTIAFAGDSYAEGALRTRLDTDPEGFVGPYAELFHSADLVVLNLETAITEGGTPVDKQFTFRAPARILDALRAGGVDVVSLANNHGMDFGPGGLEDTVAAKRAQPDGMVIGVGMDEAEAYAPHLAEIHGQRIAVLAATQVLDNSMLGAWTAGPDSPGLASAKRVDRLVAEVERWRPEVDTLVVTVHWGIETHTCPSPVQVDLARRLVDAGADVIVGGHQHRVAGGGMLDGAAVHYGLGNFLFKANSAAGAKTGAFVVEVTGRQVDTFRWEPGRIIDSVPVPLAGDDRDAARAEWDDLRGCTGLAP